MVTIPLSFESLEMTPTYTVWSPMKWKTRSAFPSHSLLNHSLQFTLFFHGDWNGNNEWHSTLTETFQSSTDNTNGFTTRCVKKEKNKSRRRTWTNNVKGKSHSPPSLNDFKYSSWCWAYLNGMSILIFFPITSVLVYPNILSKGLLQLIIFPMLSMQILLSLSSSVMRWMIPAKVTPWIQKDKNKVMTLLPLHSLIHRHTISNYLWSVDFRYSDFNRDRVSFLMLSFYLTDLADNMTSTCGDIERISAKRFLFSTLLDRKWSSPDCL